ncbi:MAG TPA: NAD-dependent epimerase/dehydratase family protein [Chitinophagaceae bacterium]
MKVTVIGGSGFIGYYLIKDFKQSGFQVNNIDKAPSADYPELTSIADIRNPEQIEEHLQPSDWLILLAAEHADNVTPTSLYYDVNVNGARNVIDVAERKGIKKILFTSTVAVYGLNKKNPTEHSPTDPFNHYGKSKHLAEEILVKWYNEKPQERSLVIIRPTVVFGPGNIGNVYNLLHQIAINKFLMIGRGNNKKSMSYVENVAAFISYCIKNDLKGYHLFNYADKPDLTTRELVTQAEAALGKKILPLRVPYTVGLLGGMCFDALSKVTGKKYSISSVRIRKFCATTQFSSVHIEETGFTPKFTLNEGLEITMKSILNGNGKH